MKKALVTGASGGIGEVFAKELAKEGYAVTSVARSEDKLKILTENLGEGHRYLVADLSDKEPIKKVMKDLEEQKYDLLVNNAGYGLYDYFHKQDLDSLGNMLDLNINALVMLSHEYLKHAKGGDSLVNVSSVLGWMSFPGGAVYAGTKAFVTNFSESLWYENKDRDVFVISVKPGATKTNFHKRALKEPGDFGPQGKMVQTAEECVAEAMVAIKARKSSSILTNPFHRRMWAIVNRLLPRRKAIEMMGERSPGLK